VPVPVSGLTGVVAIAGGSTSGYALGSDGTVLAWGGNQSGQLGDGTTSNSMVPVQVSGLTGVTAIAAASSSGYALVGF
jgi:alpha-tubulin suppressor-like RCC1 family protein